MSKKNNLIQKITNWKVIMVIQLVAAVMFIGMIAYLSVLPIKYFAIIISIIVVINILLLLLMKPSKTPNKGNVRSIIGKLLSIILSIVLLIGTLFVGRGNSTLSSISGANNQVTRYSVYVLKDSSYKSISDLKNKKVALNTQVETEKIEEAKSNLLKEEKSLKLKEEKEFIHMAKDLYNQKVDAIFMNEAFTTMFENDYPQFNNETRIIYTYELEEELEDISKVVNVTKQPFSLYISGIDTYGKVSTVSRSDVNMIVTVNPKTKEVLMTSLPRDCYVTLANKGKKDKLTHSGLAGISNTMKTVENFMSIDLNYYVRINFTSLIKIVDALGGVEINIPKDFRANADGSYFHKGLHVLNGKQALAYSRERYAFGGGDGARVQHQQQVVEAMIKKMISPAIITNYNQILNAIDGSFETNMSSRDITSLLQMQLSDNAQWNIKQQQISGTGKTMTGGAYMPNRKLYYLIPSEESVAQNKAAIQAVLK